MPCPLGQTVQPRATVGAVAGAGHRGLAPTRALRRGSGEALAENNRDLTAANRQLVLSCLLDSKAKSRVEISKMTDLAPASVNRLCKVLLDSGLVEEAGSDTSTGGRPSMLLRFNPRARRLLAVDIVSETLEAATVSLDGQILSRESIDWSGLGSEERAYRLVNYVAERVAEAADDPFVAVGVSVPGPVTEDGTVMIAPAFGWVELPLGEMLANRVDCPVLVDNDMNLYAYAEWSQVPSDIEESLVVLGVYHGIGLGIVEGGRVWRGMNGVGGQMGRMFLDMEGFTSQEHAGFGQTEEELGAGALKRKAIEAGLLAPGSPTVDPVFEAAKKGDPAALAFLEDMMLGYAFQIANFSAVIAPDTIVLGGLFERWSEVVKPILERRLEGALLQAPRLVGGRLEGNAKLIGAALYALEQQGGVLSLA